MPDDPASSDLRGTAPRPPWKVHSVVLSVALVLLFLAAMGTTGDTLNRIVLFLFVFAPLAITYAAVSTLLVWHGARQRPAYSVRRVVLTAHGLALFMGVAAGLVFPRVF